MTDQIHTNGGVSYLTSDVLARVPGVDHAFSTRIGGVSPAPHDTLNLGFYSQDWNHHVTTNWDRFLGAVGTDWAGVWYQNQLHGTIVREAPEVSGYAFLGEGDAMWTSEPRVGLCIVTADCVPVLAASRDGSAVAAAHAGWRGMVSGVVEAMFADVTRGSRIGPPELVVAAGPHIRSCCFEVKDDVARPFADRFGPEVIEVKDGRTTISLEKALRKILADAGVPTGSIDISTHCTACEPELFFSYRRDHGQERGRLASVIGRRSQAGNDSQGGVGGTERLREDPPDVSEGPLLVRAERKSLVGGTERLREDPPDLSEGPLLVRAERIR